MVLDMHPLLVVAIALCWLGSRIWGRKETDIT